MSEIPPCPACQSEYTYENGPILACPDCGNEWSPSDSASPSEPEGIVDANGNLLQSGDSVKLTKDLKVKGTSTTLKIGTKVKNIRVVENATNGHDIACKVDGLGQINLKSIFVKKV